MLDEWPRHIRAAITNEDAKTLAICFPTDLTDGNIAIIQNTLWSGDANITISQFNPDWDWPALVLFARQYLWWCYHVDPKNPARADTVMRKAFSALQTAYSHDNGYLLNSLITRLVAGFKLELWVASPLLRIFNNIRSEREPVTAKQEILLYVSNRLCRIYFTTNQTSLCSTVFRSLEAKITETYPMAQQVELRYAQGRYALIQGELQKAYQHLQWCYNNCIPGKNKALVFEQLMLPAILLGKMPSKQSLIGANEINSDFYESISLLCLSLKQVNYHIYLQALSTTWVRNHRFFNLVQSEMPALILRRAIKRLYKLKGMPRALDLNDVKSALIAAGFLTSDDKYLRTEAVCLALIDAKMMFANLIPGAQPNLTRLAMRPKDPLPKLVV